MADLIQFCHENREIVSDLGILPLYENWKPGEYEVATHTTTEDVEKMVQKSVPGGGVDFIPAGMTHWLAVMRPFFSKKPELGLLNFAGVHPNCESLTFLIHDGESYRGLNHYMNKTLHRGRRGIRGNRQEDRAKTLATRPCETSAAAAWEANVPSSGCSMAAPYDEQTTRVWEQPDPRFDPNCLVSLETPPHEAPQRASLAGFVPPRCGNPAGGTAFDRFGTAEDLPGRLDL